MQLSLNFIKFWIKQAKSFQFVTKICLNDKFS